MSRNLEKEHFTFPCKKKRGNSSGSNKIRMNSPPWKTTLSSSLSLYLPSSLHFPSLPVFILAILQFLAIQIFA
jgi:hypothetical protein